MECPEICVNLKLLAEIEKKTRHPSLFVLFLLFPSMYMYMCMYVYMFICTYLCFYFYCAIYIYIYRYWLPGITMAVVQSPISASLGITTQVFLRDDPGLLLIGL